MCHLLQQKGLCSCDDAEDLQTRSSSCIIPGAQGTLKGPCQREAGRPESERTGAHGNGSPDDAGPEAQSWCVRR